MSGPHFCNFWKNHGMLARVSHIHRPNCPWRECICPTCSRIRRRNEYRRSINIGRPLRPQLHQQKLVLVWDWGLFQLPLYCPQQMQQLWIPISLVKKSRRQKLIDNVPRSIVRAHVFHRSSTVTTSVEVGSGNLVSLLQRKGCSLYFCILHHIC